MSLTDSEEGLKSDSFQSSSRSSMFWLVLPGTCLVMFLFEIVREFYFPGVHTRESHFITIILTGLLATIATRLVFRKERDLARLRTKVRSFEEHEALRKSEEQYRTIFKSVTEGLVIFNLNAEVVEANPAMCKMHGWTRKEFLALSPDKFIHKDSLGLFQEFVETVRRGQPFHCFAQNLKRDGSPIDIEVHGAGILFQGEPHLLGIVRDITVRKQLEHELRQSQKMEAVGHLAGGVAHDFNNLLSAIIGYSEIALKHSNGSDRERHVLERIRESGERGGALTQQLLAFSRKQLLELQALDLNAEISEFAGMLERIIGEQVVLALDLSSEKLCLRGDRTQLQQIVLNLVVNARDAMSEGGKVLIETRKADVTEAIPVQGVEPGEYAVIVIRDTGHGIDPAVREHIFDPFFTTREPGKGTGLGLSTVYGIIKQHGGFVVVESKPGQGSCFEVYLPRADDEQGDLRPLASGVIRAGQGERILVVEDDRVVREMVSEMLRGNGYKVVVAENASNAEEIARRIEGALDLLLTDVIMPGRNGKELFRSLSKKYPELRVIYMSGYTHDVIGEHGVLEDGTRFLHKPFSENALLEKIGRCFE